MTALTSNAQRPVILPPGGLFFASVPLLGYTNNSTTAYTVYHGAIMFTTSGKGGYAQNLNGTPGTGNIFMGLAAEKQEITTLDLADGSKLCSVIRNGVWGFTNASSITQSSIGSAVYAHDDNAVDVTSSNGMKIGTLVAVDASYLWVDISSQFVQTT